jgi:hypothetical protein
VGDANWLRLRAAIITFEECWPLAAELDLLGGFATTSESLVRVARSVKSKNATGLGVLAYALSQGDDSVLMGSPEDRALTIVAEGIERPDDFWNWTMSQCVEERQLALHATAQRAYRRGGWPWDRALIQAAVYLAISSGVPDVQQARVPSTESEKFPYWIAIDKHTPQGKETLREAARRSQLPYRQVVWASFYLESAQTNEEEEAIWWVREAEWRLRRVKLTRDDAVRVWQQVRPIVRELVAEEAEALRQRVTHGSPVATRHSSSQERSNSTQLSLFIGSREGQDDVSE